MIRYIRTAALAITLSTVTTMALIGVGAPAQAMPLAAQPASRVHHHHHHRHHARRHRHHRRRLRGPSTSRRGLFGVTPRMMAAAARVSRCEEGGNWHFAGTSFDGGIGWTPENWARFRKPSWPRFMHDAPPHMQANALFRFVHYFGIPMPDQNGACAGY